MGHFSLSDGRRERAGRTVRVVRIEGDLDAHTFPQLQDRLERALADGDRAIVLDCQGLAYISSAGLGVLKKMVKEVRTTGGDIRVAALSEKIQNIVNLLGFSKIIQVFATVDEAVESF
jgi:anti-anti-sigma factor